MPCVQAVADVPADEAEVVALAQAIGPRLGEGLSGPAVGADAQFVIPARRPRRVVDVRDAGLDAGAAAPRGGEELGRDGRAVLGVGHAAGLGLGHGLVRIGGEGVPHALSGQRRGWAGP